MTEVKHSCIFLTILAFLVLNVSFMPAIEKPVWAYKDFSHFNSSYFIENKGQLVDKEGNVRNDVKFYFSSGNMTAYFTPNSIIFVTHQQLQDKKTKTNSMLRSPREQFLSSDRVSVLKFSVDTLQIVNTSSDVRLYGSEANGDVLNFYYSHCPDGILGVKTYKKIVYRNVYDKIDFVVYAQGKKFGFKYDFIVHKGGNPKDIKIRYAGSKTKQNADGSLTVSFDDFQIRESNPLTYHVVEDKKEIVNSHFVLKNGIISFDVQDLDKEETLIIDPVINWQHITAAVTAIIPKT